MKLLNLLNPVAQYRSYMSDVQQAKMAWNSATTKKTLETINDDSFVPAYALLERVALYTKVALKTIIGVALVAVVGLAVGYAVCHAMPVIAATILSAMALAGIIALGAMFAVGLVNYFTPKYAYFNMAVQQQQQQHRSMEDLNSGNCSTYERFDV